MDKLNINRGQRCTLIFVSLIVIGSAGCRLKDSQTKTIESDQSAAPVSKPELSATPRVRKFAAMILDKEIDASVCPDYKTRAQTEFHCKLAAVCDPCWVNPKQWESLLKPPTGIDKRYYIRIIPERLRLPSNVKIRDFVIETPMGIYESLAHNKDILHLSGHYEVNGIEVSGLNLEFIDGVPRIQLTEPTAFKELIKGKTKFTTMSSPYSIKNEGKLNRVFGYTDIFVESPFAFCDRTLPIGSIIWGLTEVPNQDQLLYDRLAIPRPGKKIVWGDPATYREYKIGYPNDYTQCTTREVDPGE